MFDSSSNGWFVWKKKSISIWNVLLAPSHYRNPIFYFRWSSLLSSSDIGMGSDRKTVRWLFLSNWVTANKQVSDDRKHRIHVWSRSLFLCVCFFLLGEQVLAVCDATNYSACDYRHPSHCYLCTRESPLFDQSK